MLKPKKKLTRKQIKEDKFLTQVDRAIDFFNQNSKTIFTILAGLIVVVVIGYLIVRSKTQANIAASGRLVVAVEKYNNQQYDEAIPQLQNIVDRFSGTKSAGEACFYLANAYYYKENYSEAKKFFQKYLDDYGDNHMFESSAMAGIAACLVQEGNYTDAAEMYLKAAQKNPESFTSPDFLFSAALNYVKANNKTRAVEILNQLIDQYSKSTKINEAKILLAELTPNS